MENKVKIFKFYLELSDKLPDIFDAISSEKVNSYLLGNIPTFTEPEIAKLTPSEDYTGKDTISCIQNIIWEIDINTTNISNDNQLRACLNFVQ